MHLLCSGRGTFLLHSTTPHFQSWLLQMSTSNRIPAGYLQSIERDKSPPRQWLAHSLNLCSTHQTPKMQRVGRADVSSEIEIPVEKKAFKKRESEAGGNGRKAADVKHISHLCGRVTSVCCEQISFRTSQR